MLSSVSQVNEQFFALFSGIKIKDHGTGALIDVPVRYARKSAIKEIDVNNLRPLDALMLLEKWQMQLKGADHAG